MNPETPKNSRENVGHFLENYLPCSKTGFRLKMNEIQKTCTKEKRTEQNKMTKEKF